MPEPEPPPAPPATWHKQQIQTEMGDPKALKLILNQICRGGDKYILKRVSGNRWLVFSEKKLTDDDIENLQTRSYRSRSQVALGLTTIMSSRDSAANSREPSPRPRQFERTDSMASRVLARATKNWKDAFFRAKTVLTLTPKVKHGASEV